MDNIIIIKEHRKIFLLFDLVEKKYLTELKKCFHHLLRVSVAFTVKLLILPPPTSKKNDDPES